MNRKITFLLSLLLLGIYFPSRGQAPITGVLTLCTGTSTPLSDADPGGVWSSGSLGVATVDPVFGVVYGAGTAGTSVITYTTATTAVTATVTVSGVPSGITGPVTVCMGSTISLTDLSPGGTWTSDTPSTASVDLTTGLVTGVALGSVTIKYSTACGDALWPVTVLPVTAAIYSPTTSVCSGSFIVLSDPTPGGTWSSSVPAVASITTAGTIVTGGTPGTTVISYSNGCGTQTYNITTLQKPAAIVGVFSFCFSSTAILGSSPTGGTWAISDPTIGSIVTTTGVFTAGSSAGSALVIYTLPDGCAVTSGVVVNNCPPCPINSDLELGDFSHWQYFTGTCCPGGVINATTPATLPSATYVPLAFALTGPVLFPNVIGNQNDPFGGFPVVGTGVYSLRIGSCRSSNWAEKAVYYVHVPPTGAFSLIYRYAVVLEDPGHTPALTQQPRFTVQAFDSATNTLMPCANFRYSPGTGAGGGPGIPGFIGYMRIGTGAGSSSRENCYPTNVPPTGPFGSAGGGALQDVWYKDWATTSINLSGLGGTTIRMEFAAGGCQPSGHFGYGYVDMTCGTFAIASIGCGDSVATVTAPSGFANYEWRDSLTFDTLFGSTQTTTFIMPNHPTTYAVIMIPFPGFGCPDTLYTRISPSNLQVNPKADTMICAGRSAPITVNATDIALPLSYSWTPAATLSCATCAIPIATPHAGVNVYTVVVTDDAGCQKTSTQKIRVDSVAATAVADSTSCFGTRDGSATVTPTVGISTYTYLWNSVPAQTTATATGLPIGTYVATVTDSAGCQGAASATVMQPPPLVMRIDSVIDDTTCNGTNGYIVLTGDFTAGTAYNIKYQFTAAATTTTVTTTVSATADASNLVRIMNLAKGIYDSIVVVTTGCPYNEVGPATIIDPPFPALPFVSSNSPVCVGATNVLNLTTTDVTPGVSYSWSGPGGFSSVSQTPSITPVVAGLAGWYIVTVTVHQCSSKDSTAVIVNSVQTPQIANDGPKCSETDTIHFLSSPTPPDGADAYLWNGPNSYLSNLQNPYLPNVAATAAGVYTVTITYHGCTASNTTTVEVVQSPAPPIVSDTNYCQKDFPPSFIAPPLTAIGDNLKWYPTAIGGTPIPTPTPSTATPSITTWYVTQTTSSVPPCTSPRAPITVGVYTLPDPKFVISDSVFCAGTAFTFNVSDYNTGVDFQGVTWGFGGGDSTQNVNPIVHSFGAPLGTVATVTVTANVYYNVCPDAILSRTVTVFSFPSLHLGSDTAICPGGEAITIGDDFNATTPGVTWLWNTGETGSHINIVAPGIFYVKATNNGCSTTDTITVANDCYMNIPNIFTPNGDGVNDFFYPRQFLTRGLSSFSMNIYNRWGQLIFTSNSIEGRGWDGNFNDVPQPEGVFIYVIDATFKDGQKEHHQGNITLLR